MACLVTVLVTLAIYWPARHYGFVDYDDNDYVFQNPTVSAGLRWYGLEWSFVDQHASNWHPLTWLSHMLDCQLFGVNPGPAHMVNVLIHCANTVLLLLLLNSLTGKFWRSVMVATLFAWHPLHVESVAWISERKDVLSGFFFMLTLWMYVLYARREAAPPPASSENPKTDNATATPRRIFYRLSLGFFILGLLSKPMLVTTPLILLLIDFWPMNRFAPCGQTVAGSKTTKIILTEKLPFYLASIVIGIITFLAQREGGATSSGAPLGVFTRVGGAVTGYLGYLEKLFWPNNLSCLYLRPAHINPHTLLIAILVLLGISLFSATQLRRPYLIMGWLWFGGMLLPVSGLIQFGLQSIADRYTYLPSIGFFIMCVWGAADLAESLVPIRVRKLSLGAVAVALLSVCALRSAQQLACWRNTETLMDQALKIDPDNYIAHADLGIYLDRVGRTRDARQQHELVRQLDPGLARSANSTNAAKTLNAQK